MKVLANIFRRALVVAVAYAVTMAVVGVDATAQTMLPGRTVTEQRVISFLSELDLSEAQKVQVEGILREERPAVETLVRQLISTHDELRAATRDGRFDETQIRAIVTRLTPAIAELIVAKERIVSRIYAVLTPAQRALFDQQRVALSAKFASLSGTLSAGSAGTTLIETVGAQLGLSQAQKLVVALIAAVEYPRIQPLVNSLMNAQVQIRAATENGRLDEAQVRAIATRQAQAMVELVVAAERVLSRLYAVLTPEQRVRIEISLDESVARLHGLLDFASIDDARFFVRQHYVDFLSREPDREGFDAWVAVLNHCGDDAQCLVHARTEVSGAFFRSQEFQLKGYFVYRFYKAAFGRLPRFAEIIPDMRSVTGQTADEVRQKRDTFAATWVERAEFRERYSGLSNAAFVDQLLATAGALRARRGEFVAALDGGQKTRAQVVRDVVESEEFFAKEYNSAFVAMQYFGYLRRDPETKGYNDWLNYLNQHPADYPTMVWGFSASTEYRRRFGN